MRLNLEIQKIDNDKEISNEGEKVDENYTPNTIKDEKINLHLKMKKKNKIKKIQI